MSITLVVNPRSDRDFPSFVDRAAAGVASAQELQDRLRAAYPKSVVRPRQLSLEPRTVWYVYREGHWVPD